MITERAFQTMQKVAADLQDDIDRHNWVSPEYKRKPSVFESTTPYPSTDQSPLANTQSYIAHPFLQRQAPGKVGMQWNVPALPKLPPKSKQDADRMADLRARAASPSASLWGAARRPIWGAYKQQ